MRTLFAGLVLSLIIISTSFSTDMGEIECGTTISKQLNLNEEHIYNFNGNAEDKILLSVRDDNSGYETYVTIYDPNDEAEFETPETSLISHVLKYDGPYSMVVTRKDGWSGWTASYNIAFFNLGACTGTPISCGETMRKRPLSLGDIDVFEFNSNAEDKILLSVRDDNSGYETYVTIYDPNHEVEFETSETSLISHVLKHDGLYTMVVTRKDGWFGWTASYNIALFNLGACTGTPISCGETMRKRSLSLGDINVFEFNGNAENKILLSVRDDNSGYETHVTIYDPNDEVEFETFETSLISHVLKYDGPYTIVVTRKDGWFGWTASYSIAFFNLGACTGTPISCGETMQDRPLSLADIDVLEFIGNAEDKILLSVRDDGAGYETYATIYDPNHEVEFETPETSLISHVLKYDGPYTIVVTRKDGWYGWTTLYTITLNCEIYGKIYVDDDAPHDPGPWDPLTSDPDEDGSKEHPYDMIQEGIDAAQDGYTITVLEGTYWETIDFMGKRIIVTGFDPDPPDDHIRPFPVIDGNNRGSVVSFINGEGTDTKLTGFTITRGLNDIGSAILCAGSHPMISNCLIVGNRTPDPNFGAAIYCVDSHSTIENCTIVDNYGGEHGASIYLIDSDVNICNCIIRGDTPDQILIESGDAPNVRYSDIQGTWPGEGNIDEDPNFTSVGYWVYPADSRIIWVDGDYHLMSEAGRWDPNDLLWIQDEYTSPCIDVGDPNSVWTGEPEPNGERINMGAYGGSAQASMSPPPAPPIPPVPPAPPIVLESWTLADDTGLNTQDKVTCDTTPKLTFVFSTTVSGEDRDIEIEGPNGQPVVPDSISGWGTNIVTVRITTPLSLVGQYLVTLKGTINDGQDEMLNNGEGEELSFTLETTPPTENVDHLVEVSFTNREDDDVTGQTSVLITITNTSQKTIKGPMWLLLKPIADFEIALANLHGTTPDGSQYRDITAWLNNGQLEPNETITRQLLFNNPEKLHIPFLFVPSVRAESFSEVE